MVRRPFHQISNPNCFDKREHVPNPSARVSLRSELVGGGRGGAKGRPGAEKVVDLLEGVLLFPEVFDQCKPCVSSHVTLLTRLHHRGVCFDTYNNGQYKTWTADCGQGIKHGLGIKCGLRTTLVKTVLIGYR